MKFWHHTHRLSRLIGMALVIVFLSSCSEDAIIDTDVLTTEDKFSMLTSVEQETVLYFNEIALGFEFGNAAEITRKWVTPVRITVQGEQPKFLVEELTDIIEELNELATYDLVISISDDQDEYNFRIFLGSGEDYSDLNPSAAQYVDNNRGLFFVNWDGAQNLNSADMYVDIYKVEPIYQRHLLREELTQALGLAMDSPQYPISIFQQSWTDVTEYAMIDKGVISLLYHPRMTSGLNEREAYDLIVDILYND